MTMNRYMFTLLLQLIFVVVLVAQTNPNHVWVNGYYRSNGTYVEGHYRTAPNHTNVDNFSTRGNINPYTLERGWVKPDGQENPWAEENKEIVNREHVKIEPYYGSSVYRSNTTSYPISNYSSSNISSNSSSPKIRFSKGDQVNVRFNSTTTSKIAFRLNKGDLVKVISKSDTKDYISGLGTDYWYEVEHNGVSGWVFGKLVGENNYNTTDLKNWNGDLKYINGNSVNVRSEPDVKLGKVKFQVNKNEMIEILAKTTSKVNVDKYGTDYWYYIKVNEKTGWVFGGLIR